MHDGKIVGIILWLFFGIMAIGIVRFCQGPQTVVIILLTIACGVISFFISCFVAVSAFFFWLSTSQFGADLLQFLTTKY